MLFATFDRKKIAFLSVLLLAALFLWRLSPPLSFPSGTSIDIPEGAGLHSLAQKLEENNVIRSPFLFRAFAIMMGGERLMKAGDYRMSHPESVFTIAWRVLHGEYDIETVRITVPEGFTAQKISELFDERFQFFDKIEFIAGAQDGYLFPDTYYFPVSASSEFVLKMFKDNFERKVGSLKAEISASGKTFEEILIMASIIEGEVRSSEDMRIVSGILWKRIEIGMPLQVDATFVYLLGKGTKDLTKDDLKVDSPYNTYQNRGLPPTPISNPGIASIRAALYPAKTNYLYFLTGDDGKMHYSVTHEEHISKKSRYINRR